MPNQPTDLVDKWYEMDPTTEDVVPNGWHLRVGMVVLVESPNYRQDVKHWASWDKADWREAKTFNRWGKVLHIEPNAPATEVVILSEYEPGEKIQFVVNASQAWIVKKDSFPSEEQSAEEAAKRLAQMLFPGSVLLATVPLKDLFYPKPSESEKPTCSGFDLATGKPCIFPEGHRFEGIGYCSDGHEKETVTNDGMPAWEKQLKIEEPDENTQEIRPLDY